MNVSNGKISRAMILVVGDPALMVSLHEWYTRYRLCIQGRDALSFDRWIRERLDDMARNLNYPYVSAEDMSEALRINSAGDAIAVTESISAREDGFKSDVNCYVEEGVVFSGVWLRGVHIMDTMDRAEDIASRFRLVGYSAELYVDERDAHEVTVNAQIDFDRYKEKRADRTLANATSICKGTLL